MNDTTKIESATKNVSVGCKLPHGLHLDLKARDGTMQRYTLKGANASRIVGGYGITEDVPAEFMTEWLKKNAKLPAVAKGLIFIHSDLRGAEAMAKERLTEASGLEPIDPIKAGMLRNEAGENDPAALKLYREQKDKNPDRNRQIIE